MDRKRAAVLGWYDHKNCGDEAYKVAFPLLFPNYDFTFVDTPKKLEALRPSEMDCVIVGGGDIIKKDFLKNLYQICPDIPLFSLSVTITEGSDLENLRKFTKVVVRDENSLLTALPYSSNAFYLPDFTFALTPVASSGRKIIESKFEEDGKTLTDDFIVCVLNSYISFNDYDAPARDVLAFNNLCLHLAKLCENSSLSWVFLPFSTQSPWDDRATSAWLCNRCKKGYEKNLVIYDRLTPQETLDVIAASRTVISTRLHSTIFSVISGVPFMDIVHHDKNYGFIETLGLKSLATNFWRYDPYKVELDLRLYTEIEENLYYEDIKGKLKSFTENAKSELKSAAPLLLP